MINFEEAIEIYLNNRCQAGQELNRLIDKVSQTDLPVLLQGETGTGKHIIAQVIHRKSRRYGRPFISVNSGTFSSEVLYKELFGVKKESDPGENNISTLNLADSGTLFISDIDKIDSVIQSKLLEILESIHSYKLDIRFITASHIDLFGKVEKGNFNRNLCYRLAIVPFNLVPLRNRKDDIPLITEAIIKNSKDKKVKGISPEALQILVNYNWPGNIRELESIVKRAIVLSENDWILPENIVFFGEKKDENLLKNKSSLEFFENSVLIDNLKHHVLPQKSKINPVESDTYRDTINKFTSVINSILNIDELLANIIKMILEIMKGENIALLLLDNSNREYTIKDMVGLPPETRERVVFQPSKKLVNLLIEENKILVLDDLKKVLMYPEYSEMAKFMEGINADICAPLVIEGILIGLCTLGFEAKNTKNILDLELFYILANQTASAIKSALTYSHILNLKDARENIIKNIMSGVMTVNLQKRITTFNKSAEEITGYKMEEVLYKEVNIIGKKFGEIVSKTVDEGKIYTRYELKIPTKNKEMIPIGMSTSHLKDEADNIVGAVIIFADLSEGMQLESQERRSERLASLGAMVAGLAHEIKNPLVSIKTFTQLLPEKYNDQEFRNNYYEIVKKEIDRLDVLIDELVNFSHLGVPNFVKDSAGHLINECLVALEGEIKKRKIQVLTNFSSDVEISLDTEQIKIVIRNLLNNAIESMPKGGNLLVTLKMQKLRHLKSQGEEVDLPETFLTEDDFVEITIKDAGCGIPEENLNKIFNPFFTTKYGAIGLGLTIVHQIVEAHNGIMKIKSIEGQGTSISINLPAKNKGEEKDIKDISDGNTDLNKKEKRIADRRQEEKKRD